MDLFRLTATARRTVMAAMLWSVVALSALANADTVPVSAAIRGELLVTPAHSRDDDLITVTVIDPDVETTVLNEAEATDFTGNTYVLPPGSAGEQTIFRVKNAPLTDLDGDGALNTSDVTTTVSTAAIAWVAPETGTFALVRGEANAAPITFTTTYRHSLVDTVKVKVTSPSDIVGFNLTLEETGPKTREFTATFKTGAASSTTNADNPGGATRPVVKVADGQLVNLEYADQSPLTLVTNSVQVDTTLPLVTILAPLDGTATRNVTEYAKVRVTDEGSGIDIADVKFHLDLDRDGVFDEPGETVAASPSLSVPINKGWEAIVLLPPVNTDGPVKWHVSVTDRAGNVARSDANASATGQQDHTFTVDTVPPRPVAAYLGSSYDEDDEEILTNQQKRLRVVFSEKLDPGSVDPKRFVIGAGNVASSGYVHEDHPDTVWLTYESLSSVVTTLTVLPGAVKDAPGFPSEMSFLDPEDQLGPIVKIETDRAVTNGPIKVDVTSEEALASPPSLTINGVTYSKMVEITPKRWTLDVDATTLTGAASGQGVKNLQIAGLDAAGNAARGGQSPEAATYPANAVLFEFDSVIKPPAIVPGQGDVATSTSPVIVVTYADELGEYAGDTHSSVTIVSAKLDGFDVTALMTATTSTSWIYQPAALSQGEHEFSVQARDDAGNIHGAIVVRFSVDAPPPTPTPTVEPTPTPTPVAVEDPGEEPPQNLQPETTVTPVPEQSPTPEPTPQPTPGVVPTATPAAEGAETPEPTATPAGITEGDIQATVTALRSEEAEAGEKPTEQDPHIAAEAGYTVFGCGLPTGNTAGAVGDYAFIGIGLLGLVAMRQRRRLLRRGDTSPGGEGGLMPDDSEG